jgi:hypothetical protein
MREMPVKKASEILGETDHKLWRMLFAHVDAAWAELSSLASHSRQNQGLILRFSEGIDQATAKPL